MQTAVILGYLRLQGEVRQRVAEGCPWVPCCLLLIASRSAPVVMRTEYSRQIADSLTRSRWCEVGLVSFSQALDISCDDNCT